MLGRSTLLEGAFINAVRKIYKEKATPELYKNFFQQFVKQYQLNYLKYMKAKSLGKDTTIMGKGSMLGDITLPTTKKLFNLMMGYENINNDVPSLSSAIENVNALYNQYAEATSRLDPNKGIEGTPREVLVGVYLLGEVVRKNHEILIDRQRELQLVAKSDIILIRALEDLTRDIQDAVKRQRTKLSLSFFETHVAAILNADLEAARSLNVISHLDSIAKSITSYKDLRKIFNLIAPVAKVKLDQHSDAIDEITNDESNQGLMALNAELGKALKQITPEEILAFNLKTASLSQRPQQGVSLADIIMSVPPTQAMSTLPSAPPSEGEQDDMAYLSRGNAYMDAMSEELPNAPGGFQEAKEGQPNIPLNTADIFKVTRANNNINMPDPSAPVATSPVRIKVAEKGHTGTTPTLSYAMPASGNTTPPSLNSLNKRLSGSSTDSASSAAAYENYVSIPSTNPQLRYQPTENIYKGQPEAHNPPMQPLQPHQQQQQAPKKRFGCF